MGTAYRKYGDRADLSLRISVRWRLGSNTTDFDGASLQKEMLLRVILQLIPTLDRQSDALVCNMSFHLVRRLPEKLTPRPPYYVPTAALSIRRDTWEISRHVNSVMSVRTRSTQYIALSEPEPTMVTASMQPIDVREGPVSLSGEY